MANISWCWHKRLPLTLKVWQKQQQAALKPYYAIASMLGGKIIYHKNYGYCLRLCTLQQNAINQKLMQTLSIYYVLACPKHRQLSAKQYMFNNYTSVFSTVVIPKINKPNIWHYKPTPL